MKRREGGEEGDGNTVVAAAERRRTVRAERVERREIEATTRVSRQC